MRRQKKSTSTFVAGQTWNRKIEYGKRLKIVAGHCTCDAPQTSKEVRLLSICDNCGELGKLVKVGCWNFHVRCAILWYEQKDYTHALRLVVEDEALMQRIRLCCIGDSIMTRLLELKRPPCRSKPKLKPAR